MHLSFLSEPLSSICDKIFSPTPDKDGKELMLIQWENKDKPKDKNSESSC